MHRPERVLPGELTLVRKPFGPNGGSVWVRQGTCPADPDGAWMPPFEVLPPGPAEPGVHVADGPIVPPAAYQQY